MSAEEKTTVISFIIGAVVNVTGIVIVEKLVFACGAAIIGGVCGVIGKEIGQFLIKQIKRRFKR